MTQCQVFSFCARALVTAFPVNGDCLFPPPLHPARFMDNLQTEMLEIEFLSYSKGMPTISEEDFARTLLRFTNVENISGYLDNVRNRIPDEKVTYVHIYLCPAI